MNEQSVVAISENPKIDLVAAVKQSIALFKANFVLLTVGGVLVAVLSGCTSLFLLGPMMMGMFIVSDRLILGTGEKPSVSDVFKGLSFFVPGLVLDIMGNAGILICGVGTFVTIPLSTWAMMRVADTGMGVGEALNDAVDFIFKKKQYMFIAVMIVSSFLATLGIVLCGVGLFLTLPFYFLVPACVYRQIYKK